MIVQITKIINNLLNKSKGDGQLTKLNRKFRARGDRFRDAGLFAQAATAYGIYLEQIGDDFGIWVQNGNCLKEAGYLTQARNAYASALMLQPDDADLYLQMGHLAKLMGNLTEALQAYSKSFELSQNKDTAIEIKNVENSLLNEHLEKTALLADDVSPIIVAEDTSLTTEGFVTHHLSSPLYKTKVPVRMITLLPKVHYNFEQNCRLNCREKEVSAFITKQTLVPSGKV